MNEFIGLQNEHYNDYDPNYILNQPLDTQDFTIGICNDLSKFPASNVIYGVTVNHSGLSNNNTRKTRSLQHTCDRRLYILTSSLLVSGDVAVNPVAPKSENPCGECE